MDLLDKFFAVAVDYAWGMPLIVLLVGGGTFLTLYSRLLPFRGLKHAIEILRGKWDRKDDPGEITHFQALTTAISSTVGMGNIAGVAVAITQGGPGAVFWMWVTAIVGMATKFFSCTLSAMYRKVDENGVVQGGPMYYIEEGLGKNFRFMAVFFSVCGVIGCLAMFQSNQLASVFRVNLNISPWMTGMACMAIVAAVIMGGIQRIGKVTSRLVPIMCLLYVGSCIYILITHAGMIPEIFARIVHDAFNGTAAAGGFAGFAVKTVIQTGVKRAAFSNEAGIGTAPMAHGAAKTREPVRQGIVAMLEPFIDTIIVCSMTAFVILTQDYWMEGSVRGVALVSQVFHASMGTVGSILLLVCVALFGISTMIGYSYYSRKCFSYLFGQKFGHYFNYFFLVTLFLGTIWSVDMVINILDTFFAFMTLPNMIAVLLLSPKVVQATRDYFSRHKIS